MTGAPDPAGRREPSRMPADALATCVLPWTTDLRLDEEAFRAHLALIAARMTTHVYLFGTAGEGHAVSEEQFRYIAGVFADESARQGIVPMLGVIAMSLGTVLDRIEYGLAAGYRQFQISFPAWGRLSDPERDLFFTEVCDRYPEALFLHYNTPRGGRVLTGAEYGRLADRHPNLVAVKFTSDDPAVVTELVEGARPLQCFLTETAYGIAARNHRCGLLVSLSGVRVDLPGRLLAAHGRELDRLVARCADIHGLLVRCLGGQDAGVHMDGAFEKMIARAHGAEMPLRLLPPFRGAGEQAFQRFDAGLRDLLGER